MATEIERKFLVTGDAWRQPNPVRMSQGYLSREAGRTVRVRIAGERAFLTVKGKSAGISRAEFEYQIPVADAEQMLRLCDGPVVEKLRHIVKHQGCTWEVDEFLGANAGLVVAEIELEREDQAVALPDWAGAEVSDDARYFNSSLAVAPYSTWSKS